MMLYLYFSIFLLVALGILLWPLRTQAAFAAAIACLFFAGSFGLYYFVGTPEILPLLEKREQRLAEIKTSILKNSEAVKADPHALEAWIRLGSDFMETGQYAAAANAFKQSVLLSHGKPALILAYAKAMIADAGGKVSDAAKKSLEMVLLQDAKNPEARYYLAIRDLQDGHNEKAMKSMKALYHSLPADSPLKEMIDAQIGRK
jgi:cytochrome c-type biogenesis protein CcmH